MNDFKQVVVFLLFRKGSVDVFSRMSFSLDELEGIAKDTGDSGSAYSNEKTDKAVKKTLKKKLVTAKKTEPLLKNAEISTPTEQPKEGKRLRKTSISAMFTCVNTYA